jgi:predicted  nucleic acid-binding Zn-ribbon protein
MICKTLKWMLLSGAVLGGAGFLFLGTDFPSYLGTMASSVRESVTGAIPVEIELKRAEGLIRQIDPQIDKCKLDLARAQIELENLQGSIAHLELVTGAEEKKLKVGAKLLSGDGAAEVMLASDSGAHRRINADLARTKDSYVNNVAILKVKRALIERQTRAVEAASQRLDSVRTERGALEDQVATLKTQKMQVEALTAQSKRFNLDDSALSQAKEVISHVKQRLDVAQRMLENDMVFQGEDPTEVAVEQRNVLKEINELFASGGTATAAVQIALPAQR